MFRSSMNGSGAKSMQPAEAELLEVIKTSADQKFEKWCAQHSESNSELPLRGRLYGAIIVLSNLEQQVWFFTELSQAISTDPGKFFSDRSIRNHTTNRLSSVLRSHGREYLIPPSDGGESGRTSGATKRAGLDLIKLVRTALENAPEGELERQGNLLVSYLYEKIFSLLDRYYLLGGIDIPFNASESISTYISKLLEAHRTNAGALLQHLVGAKLELRFQGQPVTIAHHSSATADVQTGRLGDFEIGSTVFHVTKRANDGHYRKAKQNADNGRKVYLLTPENVLLGTKNFAEQSCQGFSKKVNIFSVEQFLVQNLDELAVFERDNALRQLKILLEKYNELITRYENDQSLKIVIPDLGVD